VSFDIAGPEMKLRLIQLSAMALSLTFCSSCAQLERVVTPANVGRALVIYDEGRRILESIPEPVVIPAK
jgi:hypothetical protein